jgi:hypothetical protein
MSLTRLVGRPSLAGVRPLVDDAAFAATSAELQKFRTDPEQGPKLQQLLTEYDATTTFGSYVSCPRGS